MLTDGDFLMTLMMSFLTKSVPRGIEIIDDVTIHQWGVWFTM